MPIKEGKENKTLIRANTKQPSGLMFFFLLAQHKHKKRLKLISGVGGGTNTFRINTH